MKYIWIVGQNHDNITYTIHFLHLNISSQALIQTLLCNNTNNSTSRSEENLNNQLNIARTAILTDNALSSVAKSWKDVVSSFKTSKSTTITRITRFGFAHFDQKSTVSKAIDIPANKASEFINAIVMNYNLPSKGSFLLSLTYSEDFSWESIEYLYSPAMDGKYRSLTLFKNGDSITNTASFFIVDVNAD
ncbi:unnamed protein product [Rotaria sordida]|uniref:Uncharacterized protein n=1 Tax=Rotaria sordida TaxID=392033 RepID=A0A814W4G0_9BILA|nr:unnamed protein product [Rotaria sordida]